jgi:hypothetical protein
MAVLPLPGPAGGIPGAQAALADARAKHIAMAYEYDLVLAGLLVATLRMASSTTMYQRRYSRCGRRCPVSDAVADQSPSRRARLILYAMLLIIAALFNLGLWFASRPSQSPLQGEVEADSVNIATKALARVDRLLVGGGDRVKSGQVVAFLSSPEIGNAAQQTAATLDSARATQSLTNEGERWPPVLTGRQDRQPRPGDNLLVTQ